MRSLLRGSQGQVPEAVLDRPAEDLTAISCSDFDLERTLTSGQVFRWRGAFLKRGLTPCFIGWIDSEFTHIFQKGQALFFSGTRPKAIRNFFSLEVDLKALSQQIDVDPIIHAALEAHWGLRVIRQDPWECLSAFILSSFNNIPRLTGMLDRLAVHLSESTHPRGSLQRFPKPERIASVPERVLRNLGLGFRAPYLKGAAQAVASGKADLQGWCTLEDEELRRALWTIPGVGEKVVECVMLFAYGRTAAFPVDVWIGRAMRPWYFRRRNVTDRKIREFALKHFGPMCGWAQQYLYCEARASLKGSGQGRRLSRREGSGSPSSGSIHRG